VVAVELALDLFTAMKNTSTATNTPKEIAANLVVTTYVYTQWLHLCTPVRKIGQG